MEQQIGQQERKSRRGQHNAGRAFGTPYAPGTSGSVQHRERVEATCRELAAELGGFDDLPTFRKVLVRQAAEIICGARYGSAVVMARRANTLARLFRMLGLEPSQKAKPEPFVPALPSVSDLIKRTILDE